MKAADDFAAIARRLDEIQRAKPKAPPGVFANCPRCSDSMREYEFCWVCPHCSTIIKKAS